MKKTLLIFILLLTPFLLVGCGNQTKDQAPTNVVTKPLVTKKPIATDNRTKSYDFCENNGHEIIIRFDEVTQSSKIFCRFGDTTECEAESFLQGACGPGQGSIIHVSKTNTPDIVVCSQNYDPVCGENKITYSNDCIASINNVKIVYIGVCTETQQTNIPDANETTPIKSSTKSTNKTALVDEEINIDWLNMVKDIIMNDAISDPPAYINKCSYQGNPVYFQSNGCANCYSVLYSESGQVICYPGNNVSDECPDYFRASGSCKRIWTDSR